MKFNNGSERVRLENRWKKLRIQYREAGMSEDAIQAMYQFDLDVLNSERAYVDNTQPIFVTEDDKDSVDFKRYEKAITVTDVSVPSAVSASGTTLKPRRSRSPLCRIRTDAWKPARSARPGVATTTLSCRAESGFHSPAGMR